MFKVALSVAAFVAFTTYTIVVAINNSLQGFLIDQAQGGWSLQVLLDLVVAAGCFWIVAIPDGRRRGITVWPYMLLTPFLGSIALLGYFVHRNLRQQ
jgi:hypothetical protein